MKKYTSPLKRGLRWIGIIFGTLIVLLYIGLPVGSGVLAVFPGRSGVGSLPEGYETVMLHTSDGLDLTGWYKKPTNGAVIILLHEAGGSREGVRAYANLLAKHGYGVLSFDLRGHGESQGRTNRLGWRDTLDVGAAIEFLQDREGVERIGALGISMGGEGLLGAASQYSMIQAIAADGATRRSTQELLALKSERPLVRNFTARVMYLTVQILSGEQPPQPTLLESMLNSENTRFFLIAGGAKELEVSFNQMFKEQLGERAELWIAPEAAHVGALALYPQEYEQRLVEFFNSYLLAGASTSR